MSCRKFVFHLYSKIVVIVRYGYYCQIVFFLSICTKFLYPFLLGQMAHPYQCLVQTRSKYDCALHSTFAIFLFFSYSVFELIHSPAHFKRIQIYFYLCRPLIKDGGWDSSIPSFSRRNSTTPGLTNPRELCMIFS